MLAAGLTGEAPDDTVQSKSSYSKTRNSIQAKPQKLDTIDEAVTALKDVIRNKTSDVVETLTNPTLK